MVREMGLFKLSQRTKDGYFDANALVNQWNSIRTNTKRDVTRFLDSTKTKEFIKAIEEDSQHAEMQDGVFQVVIKKKGRITKKGRTKDETWMHPYLFIDFAMWINPKFKLQVIKFVYDQLIENRHLSGDNYRVLTSAAAKLPGVDFTKLARALNWVVFGMHGKGLRQTATQQELKELTEVEKQLAFSIDMELSRIHFIIIRMFVVLNTLKGGGTRHSCCAYFYARISIYNNGSVPPCGCVMLPTALEVLSNGKGRTVVIFCPHINISEMLNAENQIILNFLGTGDHQKHLDNLRAMMDAFFMYHEYPTRDYKDQVHATYILLSGLLENCIQLTNNQTKTTAV